MKGLVALTLTEFRLLPRDVTALFVVLALPVGWSVEALTRNARNAVTAGVWLSGTTVHACRPASPRESKASRLCRSRLRRCEVWKGPGQATYLGPPVFVSVPTS
jgi:hypothetical protein